MQIWLINPYGPVPSESWRDYRFTMMADALTSAGYDIVWWTSNFSHHFKRFRSNEWKDIHINEKFIVRLVPTTAYKRNIGIGRILRDAVFAYRTYIRGRQMTSPDCIIYSETPLTFGYAGQKLAKFHNCPVVFDQMDLWPELFEQMLPKYIRPVVKWFLSPVYRNRSKVYSSLDGVIALAKPYLDVPLREAPVLRSRPHRVIYNGIDVAHFRQLMHKDNTFNGKLPQKKSGEIWAIFAGSLGPSYDIPTILRVAKHLESSDSQLSIIIAGDGPNKAMVEDFVKGNPTARLYYVGKLLPEQLAGLYKKCDIALCAYSSRSNVEMPDKIYDYTAAGLPVVNSLLSEISEVIKERKIGVQYRAGDSGHLLAVLEELGKNQFLREEMARNSFLTGMTYDKHAQYSNLVGLTEQLISRKQ